LDLKRLERALDCDSKLGLLQAISLSEAQAIISAGIPNNCTTNQAIEYAQFMGRAMPTGAGTDFEIWIDDATLIFSEYPVDDVNIAVKHPTLGLRSKHKWLPQPSDLIEFLNAMRTRRYRILGNARYVVTELSKPIEPEQSPSERARLARKFENLAREFAGKRSLDAIESTREQQTTFDAECLTVGNGDKQAGLEVLLRNHSVSLPIDIPPLLTVVKITPMNPIQQAVLKKALTA
jgi:hypothetical protein